MNDSGVLGRFIPEFGHVVSMMQFNMYHHYTVDEHLIRTIGMLTDIERGGSVDELPLSTELMKTVQNRPALYVGALPARYRQGPYRRSFDRRGAHSAEAVPRLGLTPAETETVAWLIEHHLMMSNIAQSRDLSDPKTIRDFRRHRAIAGATEAAPPSDVADIRAVGPGTWNGWKGQLLRTLFYETEPLVAGGHTHKERGRRVAELSGCATPGPRGLAARAGRALHRPPLSGLLAADRYAKAGRARAVVAQHRGEWPELSTDLHTDVFTAVSELTIFAPNHPRLLALFAGSCAAAGANIVGAHITTTRDGFALDTFLLAREFPDDEDEKRRGRRIGETIDRLLKGEARLAHLLAKRAPAWT